MRDSGMQAQTRRRAGGTPGPAVAHILAGIGHPAHVGRTVCGAHGQGGHDLVRRVHACSARPCGRCEGWQASKAPGALPCSCPMRRILLRLAPAYTPLAGVATPRLPVMVTGTPSWARRCAALAPSSVMGSFTTMRPSRSIRSAPRTTARECSAGPPAGRQAGWHSGCGTAQLPKSRLPAARQSGGGMVSTACMCASAESVWTSKTSAWQSQAPARNEAAKAQATGEKGAGPCSH